MSNDAPAARVDGDSARLCRRHVLGLLILGSAATLAACAAPASAPTTAPTKPTAAPAKPAATTPAQTTPAKPTAAAASKPAATAAPKAKPSFTPVTVKMASAYTAAGSVPWRMGIELGHFREFGINLEPNVVSGSANVIAALSGGEVLIAEGGVPSPLAAIEKGQPFKLLSGSYTKPAYYVFARPHINSLHDIKIIGANRPGSLTYSITATILRNEGIDIDKLQFISIGSSNDIYTSVVAGRIDAGIGDIAMLLTAERDGVKPLVKAWEKLPDYLSACIYCTEESLKSQRDVIVRTLAGFARSYRFSRLPEARDPWIKVAREQLNEDEQQAQFEYEWIRDYGGVSYDLELPPAAIQYMQEQNIQGETQDKIVPYEQIADTSVARDALALLEG